MAIRTTARRRFAVPVPPEGIEALADHVVLTTGEDFPEDQQKPALALHAFNFAAAMSVVAHRQLGEVLAVLAKTAVEKRQLPEEHYARVRAEAMLHAWSLLDLGFRVRNLVERLAGYVRVKNCKPWRDFAKTWGSLREPRNGSQHIDSQLGDLVSTGVPAWGYLTWRMKHSRRQVTAHMFAPGLVRRHDYKLLRPSVEDKNVGVHDVRLQAFGVEVSLTRLAADIADVVRATADLEIAIIHAFDMTVTTSVEPIIINRGSATPAAAATSK